MNKKRIEVLTSAALLSSVIVSTLPAETALAASSSITATVSKAQSAANKAYNTLFGSKVKSVPNIKTLESQVKAADSALKSASKKAKDSKSKASIKACTKKLVYVKNYIIAYKEAEKVSKSFSTINADLLKNKSITSKNIALIKSITNAEKIIKSKITNTKAKKLLTDKFITPAKVASQGYLKIVVQIEAADKLLKAGKYTDAEKKMAAIEKSLKKLDTKTSVNKAVLKYATKINTDIQAKIYDVLNVKLQQQVEAYTNAVLDLTDQDKINKAKTAKSTIDTTGLATLKIEEKQDLQQKITEADAMVAKAEEYFALKQSKEEAVAAVEHQASSVTTLVEIKETKVAIDAISFLGLESADKTSLQNRLDQVKSVLDEAEKKLVNAIPENGEINEAGQFGGTTVSPAVISSDVKISSKDVILKNVTIKGDLYIEESVADGDVTLENVKVEGKTYVKGGGENSIHFNDSVLATVIVNKNDGRVRIVASGNSYVAEVQLESYAKIEESDLSNNADGFKNVTVDPTVQTTDANLNIELVGRFETINSKAEQVRIHLTEDTDIRKLVLNAVTSVLGAGTINLAEINKNGSTIDTTPANLVLNNGTVTINNEQQSESYSQESEATLEDIRLAQNSIDVTFDHYVAGITIYDFDIKATIDGQEVALENLNFNPNTQRISFTPVNIATYKGKTLTVQVTPKGKLSGDVQEATTEISTGISGRITDVAEVGFDGVQINFRKGINNKDGEIVSSVTTDRNGYYSVSLPEGEYTGEITGDGVVTTYLYAAAPSDVFGTNQNETAIRAAASSEMKIVLSWGEYPEDVDSHLIGSKIGGDSFHVFYGEKEFVQNDETIVDLDWDDTDSYGPETTTLRKLKDGQYIFYLHNYSGNDGNITLQNSGAVVQIYKGNSTTPEQTYKLTPGTGNQLYWLGFGLDVSNNGSTVDIIPIDKFEKQLNNEDYQNLSEYLPRLIDNAKQYLEDNNASLTEDQKSLVQNAILQASTINVTTAKYKDLLLGVVNLKAVLNDNTTMFDDYYDDGSGDDETGDEEDQGSTEVDNITVLDDGETVNDGDTYEISSNDYKTLDVNATDIDGNYVSPSNYSVQWESSNQDVAQISEDGSMETYDVTSATPVTFTLTVTNGTHVFTKEITFIVNPEESTDDTEE